MRHASKKLLSIALVLVYGTTQVALGSLAESNVWKQRRNALTSRDRAARTPILASLPNGISSVANTQEILRQLPSLSGALQSRFEQNPVLGEKSIVLTHLKSLVDGLPLAHCTIQDAFFARNSQQAPVLLLQDVHLQAEAQANIAAALQELIDQHRVGLVGVEGAFGPFDFRRLRAFPDKKAIRDVATSFLEENKLAAPSFVGITSPNDLPLFLGVDDQRHYNANVQAALDSLRNKDAVRTLVADQRRLLEEKKKTVFSSDLSAFDARQMAYRRGAVGFGAYVKKLAEAAAPDSLRSDGNLTQFIEAYETERELDFGKVESERRLVLEKLAHRSSAQELSDLLAMSLSYRLGRITFGAYYQYVKECCAGRGVNLRQTPDFDRYVRTVLLSDGLNAERLFESVGRLEKNIIQNLAKTAEEKKDRRRKPGVDSG